MKEQQEIRRQANRLPTVKEVIVTRFWPLTLFSDDAADLNTPCFDPDAFTGEVSDTKGRTDKPNCVILLNAAVTDVISGDDE